MIRFIPLIAALAVAGCDPAVTRHTDTPLDLVQSSAPPGKDASACWSKTETPATLETQTQKILVKPAQLGPDGHIQEAPQYRTESRATVVTARQDNWFQTPCPSAWTPAFISSVQRALTARGAYDGAISGEVDAQTRAAILAYQQDRGLNSATLSVETAQALGLWVVDFDRDTSS
ncbi:MAG: peptidoglycan-binding domain-containing protein [Paracoccaceae bacterium]